MWSRRWRRLLQTLDVFHSWTSLKCHFVWNFDLLFYFPKINGSLISITHLSDRYCSTTTLEGWVVTTSIWFHPLSIPLALHLFIHYICPAPIIHCICARRITFLWGDNCICPWSMTFVRGVLHLCVEHYMGRVCTQLSIRNGHWTNTLNSLQFSIDISP